MAQGRRQASASERRADVPLRQLKNLREQAADVGCLCLADDLGHRRRAGLRDRLGAGATKVIDLPVDRTRGSVTIKY